MRNIKNKNRALDKREEYLMIIFYCFLSKPYVETPHLNRLAETVSDEGPQQMFYAELTKIIPNYHQIHPPSYQPFH